ncbi:MAG: thiamine pyrophosphate-binding protein [Bacteroidia bacterium]|nr:thiamine pyrophosphate-binding protein [Bacteroidia bacterium]
MKKTGAKLAVYALEQIGVKYTFGIPGVHNTELYDELNISEQIEPILVTHEGGAAFMGDGVSRTSGSIGCLVIVPAAGLTHAMSGIGEAYLDGIPLLVISGGTRRDSGKSYQLHQIDQGKILDGIIKKYFLIERHGQVIPTIYEAYETAISGEPGPVFVEIPVELQLFQGEIPELTPYRPKGQSFPLDQAGIKKAVDLLTQAQNPGMYIGWGGVDASEESIKLAEALVSPVATTFQGISSFPGNHPLHTGVGTGPASVPASQKAFANCDCVLAVGARFAELATGSFGAAVPENLIHIDINPEVFHKNYPAKVALHGDAKVVLQALNAELASRNWKSPRDKAVLGQKIQADKAKYYEEWTGKKLADKVSPGHFFQALRKLLPDDAFAVVDDGKHTFLTAELYQVRGPRRMISPTDFNCMGYAVPSSIGVKISNPDKVVATIVGDGAFMMTCMELVTASANKVGVMVFVFHDGELGQISQFQAVPLNRKTCTVIGQLNVEGVAMATGAHFVDMQNDHEIEKAIQEAMEVSKTGRPVIIDVNIDYSKKTFLTKGVIKTNLNRFPFNEKVRFIGRALKRHVFG